MKRRTVSFLTGLALAAFLFVICAGEAMAQSRKPITFWFWGPATPYQELMKKVLGGWYDSTQSQYHLSLEFRNTVDKDIPVALAANNGPDIVYASGPSYTSVYAQEDKVLDLNKYSDQYGWKKRLLSVMYDACTVNGKLYSVPNAILISGIFYNKELFKEKGWKVPTTMAEFTALCDTAIKAGLYALSAGNKGWRPCNDHFSEMIVNHNIAPSNMYKCLTGQLSFDNPEMVKAVALSAAWYKKGYLSGNDYPNLNSQDVMQLLADKRAAMVIAPTLYIQFAAQSFLGADADKVGFAPMPSTSSKDPIYDVSMACNFSIAKTSKYPDECAKILDHMMTAQFLADMTKGWPGYWTVPVKDLSSVNANAGFTGLSKMTIDAIKQAAPYIDKGNFAFHPSTFFPPATITAWEDIDSVWQGVLTPEEFCKNVAAAFGPELTDKLVCPLAKPAY